MEEGGRNTTGIRVLLYEVIQRIRRLCTKESKRIWKPKESGRKPEKQSNSCNQVCSQMK